jgi:ATP-binding cassette subfamily B protein
MITPSPLARNLRSHAVGIALITLCMASVAAYNPVVTLSFRPIIDAVMVRRELAAFERGILLIVLFFLLMLAGNLGGILLSARLSARFLMETRLQMFARLQRLSMRFFGTQKSGDLVARFASDMAALHEALVGGFPFALVSVLQAVPALCIMLYLDWRLGGLGLASVLLIFGCIRLIGPAAKRHSLKQREEEARLAAYLQENIWAQPIIKLFRLEERVEAQFRERALQLGAVAVRATLYANLTAIASLASVGFIMLSVICIGGYLGLRGLISAGTFVAFLGAFITFSMAVNGLASTVPRILQAAGGIRRISELLTAPLDVVDAEGASETLPADCTLRFEQVSLRYNPQTPVLDAIDLEIRAGESVAIVGPSGGGKSTLLSLLMRFRDPDSGCVKIGGTDLRQLRQSALRAGMGAVFQESYALDLSIRDNIRLGCLSATDAEVERAARDAELHDRIMSLPEGYDTLAGERGGIFSGGQRQRLAIARALLSAPKILLLDEPTAALDPETEANIQETLRRIGKGRTVISVTHRLSWAVHCDRILLLEKGRLVEQGTHAELLARGGRYARLWADQSGFLISPDGKDATVLPERLREIAVLKGLSDAQYQLIAGYFVSERLEPGRAVFQQGDPADRLYLIARGEVEVTARDPGGNERRLVALRDGDVFGEIGLLMNGTRTASVRATLPTLVLSLSAKHVVALFRDAPELRERLMATAEERLRRDRLARAQG